MQDPLLNNYAVPAGHFDELLDASGGRATGGRRSRRTPT
jgi:hypothetical protein